jgi:tripartite-type tricarboxylate transporter receptor subunit TctC
MVAMPGTLTLDNGMKCHRRKAMAFLAGAAFAPALSTVARALEYPTRPVRIMVGFAPGGTPDLIARLVGLWISQRLDQPFVVENHLGAASNLALEDVARAPPDGYTLLEVSLANAINANQYEGVSVQTGIAPIAGIASAPFIIVVNPGSGAQTVPGLIAYAKAHPGKLNFGSAATGTPPYLAVSLLKSMAKIDFVQVPYRNSVQAVEELLGGRLDIAISDMSVIEYVKTRKLHALAVTAATRQNTIPDVPSMAEFLPGYNASSWYGLGATKPTPADIIDKLSAAVDAVLADPEHAAHLAKLGLTVNRLSALDFGKFVDAETKKWGEVITAANIKPE